MIYNVAEVDYSQMEKGDVLSVEHCEAVLGISRKANTSAYNLALMGIVSQVQRDLWHAGRRYTVATHHGQVKVLTDPEASEYNDKHFESGLSKSRRASGRMRMVDVGKLDSEQRQHHDRNLVKHSHILSAIRKARKDLELPPYNRNTPTLG